MLPGISSILAGLFIFLGILILLFFVFRELLCWYWKINKMVGLLESIDLKLSQQLARPAAAAMPGGTSASGTSGTHSTANNQPTAAPVDPGRYVCGEFSNNSLQAVINYSIEKSGRRYMVNVQDIVDELTRKYEVGSAYESWNVEKLVKESENPDFSEDTREKMKKVISDLMQQFNIKIQGK